MSPAAPTTEIGQANLAYNLPGWKHFTSAVDEREYAPDVRWPLSVATYERMETDAHLAGLLLGTFLPIRRRPRFIDPNGASDQVAEECARDFGVPLLGEEQPPSAGRLRNRFSHDRHLAHALRALVYGHYFFEQVGEIVDGRWRLRKLAPRPPFTLSQGGSIEVAPDGGLKGIKQGIGLRTREIPVSRLVAYVWDQEAANWFGRSLLRPCLRSWAVKDRLIRVDAMKHERNSMGVPWFETGPELTQPQVDALAATAQRMRSGDQAGGAGPGKLMIKGVDGSLPDTVASIEMHDRQMSMAFLSMFADLGRNSQNGARSLGETFVDLHVQAQDTISEWYDGITTEHAIWDWVDWNFGGDEGAPTLVSERSEDPELAVQDLATLVSEGVIAVDPPLEDAIRGRYQLPPRDEDAPAPSPPVELRAKRPRTVSAAATLPQRETREPTAAEMAAEVDFAAMDTEYTSARDELVAAVRELQPGQIEELRAQIEEADGDLEALAAIACAPVAAAVIAAAMRTVNEQGIAGAAAEAEAQGVDPVVADVDEEQLLARAAATDVALARSLSDAGARRALLVSGGSLTPAEVADEVGDHLGSLTDAFLEQELGAALVESQNAGRKAVMAANDPSEILGSALLDETTCEQCETWDGEGFETLEEAEAQFPAGNKDCLGGGRCRCTVVAIYGGDG